MTTLRDATLDLERGVNAALGDEITYTPAGGQPQTFNTWVEFDSEYARGSNSSAEADAIAVEVTMDRVALPGPADRVAIALLPGKLFAMSRRRRSATGAGWIIALKQVAA